MLQFNATHILCSSALKILMPISCQSSGYAHPVRTLVVLSYSKAMLVRVPMSLGTLTNLEMICPLVCTSLSLKIDCLS